MACCGASGNDSGASIQDYKTFLANFTRDASVENEFAFIVDVIRFERTEFTSWKQWNKAVVTILNQYARPDSPNQIEMNARELSLIDKMRADAFDGKTARYIFRAIYNETVGILMTNMSSYLIARNYKATAMQVFRECLVEDN